jgi:hypothetical protein
MTTLTRLIQGCVIAGFLVSSSGCLIVPEHEHEHDRDRDREVREHEHDRDRHCDEHDERCRDR